MRHPHAGGYLTGLGSLRQVPRDDESTVIELKQGMVKEAVIADLVHVQGWNREDVERELGPVLESMRYL